MALFQKLLQAVRSWRRRRSETKAPSKRAEVAMESLDDRQLLAVSFTGNVLTDFPSALANRGVVILDGRPPGFTKPVLPVSPPLQQTIQVSGFEIAALRVSYTPADDTLSLGIEQPRNPKDPLGRQVLAGDADNDGDAGRTSAAVLALDPEFDDQPNLLGSEFLGVFLDLNRDGLADVVAGFPQATDLAPKAYTVADAINSPGNPRPAFGAARPQNTGAFFLANNPDTPNFELSITNFSQLFLEKTGQPLTPASILGVGAFGGSPEGGISEAFLPPQNVPVVDASPPVVIPPCPVCPPQAPFILINPHENRHVNTAHPSRVRATVFGTSGFLTQQIVTETVRLGGAAPVNRINRDVNRDGFLDATFVFRGNQITLPPGLTDAELTGTLANGQPPPANTFVSRTRIFNRDASFYTPAQRAEGRASQAARKIAAERVRAERGGEGLTGPVVAIGRRKGVGPTVKIPVNQR